MGQPFLAMGHQFLAFHCLFCLQGSKREALPLSWFPGREGKDPKYLEERKHCVSPSVGQKNHCALHQLGSCSASFLFLLLSLLLLCSGAITPFKYWKKSLFFPFFPALTPFFPPHPPKSQTLRQMPAVYKTDLKHVVIHFLKLIFFFPSELGIFSCKDSWNACELAWMQGVVF